MALTTTTLSAAVAASDISIKVASATGFAAGYLIRIDGESMKIQAGYVAGSTTVPVQRGVDGTAQVAHAISANVTVGTASDWATPAQGTATLYPVQVPRPVTSYSASGALTLPNPGSDAVAILNGTSVRAMTLANPTKDMDGSILYIIGNGKAAHTVTYTAGFGNASTGYTVGTFDTGGQCAMALMAANGIWVPLPSPMSGTLTAIDVAIA